MSATEFGIEDLKRILAEGAGEPDGPGVETESLDADFDLIGYDSLALLETSGRIEREYGVHLEEGRLTEMRTPRALIEFVNGQLAESVQSAS
jgi:act minimal PKS acyl carrier protein